MPILFKTFKPRFEAGKILFLFLAACLIVSCSNEPPADPETDQTSDLQKLSDRITGLTPEGWEIFDKVKVFTAENLYEHINGRAELYLSYDVKNLTTATFEKKSDIEEFMELSIFDMDTATNAFGIFSVERFQDESVLDLGRKSYRSGSSIFIWKGKFYITLVTSDTSDKRLRLSLNLAQKITAFLSDSEKSVWGLSALPQKKRVPDSVKYFKVDALGLDFMHNTYTAKYRKNGVEITVFLSQQNSSESARDSVTRYSKYAVQYGRGSRNLKKDGVKFVLCDMDGSFDVIFQKGRLAGGVQSVIDRAAALEAAAELWAQIDFE